MDELFQFDWSFIDRVGDNPFQAMLFFFLNGGWIAILFVFLWASAQLFKGYKQNIYNSKIKLCDLYIDVNNAV